jgi:hypothetical protein
VVRLIAEGFEKESEIIEKILNNRRLRGAKVGEKGEANNPLGGAGISDFWGREEASYWTIMESLGPALTVISPGQVWRSPSRV